MARKYGALRLMMIVSFSIFVLGHYAFFFLPESVQADEAVTDAPLTPPPAETAVPPDDEPSAPPPDQTQNNIFTPVPVEANDVTNPTSEPATSVPLTEAAPVEPTAVDTIVPTVENVAFATPQTSQSTTQQLTETLMPDTATMIPSALLTVVLSTQTATQAEASATKAVPVESAVTATFVPLQTAHPKPTESLVTVQTDAALPIIEATEAPTAETTVETETRVQFFALAAVEEPDVELGVTCPSPGTASFTLRNVGGDMLNPGSYSISRPPQNSAFQLAAGGSISFQAAGDATVDAEYTTSSGAQVFLSATGQCLANPTPVPTSAVTFTPSNTPTMTLTATNTRIPTQVVTRTPTSTPTITLTPSSTPVPSLTYTPSITPSPTITLTPSITFTPSDTPTPTITLTSSNTPTPTITLTPSLTFTPSATFTPSNTPTPTFTPTLTFTPTITLTPSLTFTPSATYTPSNTPAPTATATFQPGTTLIELSVACLPPLDGTLAQARFRLRNVRGDMLTPGILSLDAPGEPLRTESFLLMAGEKQDFVSAGNTDVRAVYSTLTISNVSLGVTGTCIRDTGSEAGTATATPVTPTSTPTATNTPVPATNTLIPTSIPVILATNTPAPTTADNSGFIPASSTPLPESGSSEKNASVSVGDSSRTRLPTLIPASEESPAQITDNSTGLQMALPQSNNDFIRIPFGANPLAGISQLPLFGVAVAPADQALCPEGAQMLDDGFPVSKGRLATINSDCNPTSVPTSLPDWIPVQLGAETCPDWLVYHTNMTGDWELFRLGDLPSGVLADRNLSRGIGAGVHDLMPTLSFDRGQIAFTSNRDGNWEIYLSAIEVPLIQRVTYTNATELDPVWSPVDGRIVYESNRDGNWNLYLFDMLTGIETRLTEAFYNEVNAAWSHDGKRILFQSDREGRWQIYELTLATGQQRKLSDGTSDDWSPQYSNDDEKIVFQSTRDSENNAIYLMDTDSTDVTLVSDPDGNALNPAWSPDDRLIAYQSDLDGDDDIYIYEVDSGLTRHLTDNTIRDYAPTWECRAPVVVFTSDITGDANLFSSPALPIKAPSIKVEHEAEQLTFDPASDQYPLSSPNEEDASRNG